MPVPFNLSGSTSFGIIIFITYLVPPTLLFIPLASVIAELHLLDSPWALILTYLFWYLFQHGY